MLSVRHIPRTQIAMPYKWISIAHNTIRLGSNSSSSSSDSSDSDSDLGTRPQKQTVRTTNSNSNVKQKKNLDLYELIDYYAQKIPSKQVDIKINKKDKAEQLDYRITKVAEILTSSVGGDKEKVISSLLFSLSAMKSEKQSTKPIKKFPSKFKSRNVEKKTLKNESMKTRMNNENKSRISELKSYINNRRTADMKTELDSIHGKLLKMDHEANKSERKEESEGPPIIKQIRQKHEKQKKLSISQSLLQNDLSVTEQASKKIQTRTKPTMLSSMSMIQQLLKDQNEKSFASKTLPGKKPLEPSRIQQLREQQSTSHTLLHKKSEQLSLIKDLVKKVKEKESQSPESVINKLLKDYREQTGPRQKERKRLEAQEIQKMIAQQPSVSKMMLNNVSNTRRTRSRKSKKEHYMERETDATLHWILFDEDVGEKKRNEEDMSMYYKIFDETNAPSKTAELETWNLCEKKYMKMITMHYPENAFQEMAQWTEEGKMWNFPIDNEQGMDEEHSIHFSEHVFLERHLAGWCPTKGPIRHFMELVCIGLSKNPYMTVQEKYDTIMWYKEFFADKNDLLKKLGLSEIGQNVEKQAQLSQ